MKKKLPKIQVQRFDDSDPDLDRIKTRNLQRAKDFFAACPFATPTYMCLKTGLPLQFILDNRKEIGI